MSLVYRENKGAPLTVQEIDGNFAFLNQRLELIENGRSIGVDGIDRIEQDGSTVLFFGTSGAQIGSIQIPAGLQFRGNWKMGEFYTRGDVISYQNSSYVCLISHTSSVETIYQDIELERWAVLALGAEDVSDTQFFVEYGDPNTIVIQSVAPGDTFLNALNGDLYKANANKEWQFISNFSAATAEQVSFNNTNTSLNSDNIQSAIEELDLKLNNIQNTSFNVDGGLF